MVRNGIDNIDQYDKFFRNKRLGLITSVSGVDNKFRPTIDILKDKYNLVALFSPEHGVRGDVGAGGNVEEYVDEYTGIKVYSLYRKDSKHFTKDMLDKIDTLVFDIQDLGVRYYTFISTMYYAMQDCDKYNKDLVILDRMNPLGDKVEGNLLKDEYKSFVGCYPITMRYGLTIGELALLMYDEQHFKFKLTVVSIEGWNRNMTHPDTGNFWIAPSSGIPKFENAQVYPGMCLFEGTNISEGRGTTSPFENIGAPFIDAVKISKYLNDLKVPGTHFMPTYFTPSCSKFKGEACEGVHIYVTDRDAFNSCDTGVILLKTIWKLYPDKFEFLKPYQVGGRRFIELLFGTNEIENEFISYQDIIEKFHEESETFCRRKEKYQIY